MSLPHIVRSISGQFPSFFHCLKTHRRTIFPVVVIIIVILLVYQNSLTGAFIFDDVQILNNPRLHHLWPIQNLLTNTNRPVLDFTFALNYTFSGNRPFGYHFFNVIIHICATLVLYGVVRRTLLSRRLGGHFENRAIFMALSVVLIWALHPLQTESVAYIIQRAESLMGLFYLLTLYAVIRADGSRQPFWWYVGAWGFCVLGMGTKEVMVTAPVIIFIYDWVFLSGTLKRLLEKRKPLYVCMVFNWLLPAYLLTHTPDIGRSVGFFLKGLGLWQYAVTQPGVILH